MTSLTAEVPVQPRRDDEVVADAEPARPVDGRPGRRHGPSIGIRLLVLVLIALAPAALVGASIFRSWATASEDDAARSVQRLAEAAAVHQENLVASTGLLLEALSKTPSVTDADTCASTLRDLSGALPQYAVMGVADAEGDFWCSSKPTDGPVTVVDRSYFIEARRTGEPAVGEYQIGRVTGKPTVVVAHPLPSDDGSFAGVVVASIDLSRPAQLAERLELPDGSTVTVYDETGTVLMRWPVSEGFVGTAADDHLRALQESSSARQVGLDGVERVYGVAELAGAQNAPVLSVGVPVGDVESAAGTALDAAARWFAVIIALAGAAALAVARSTVLRPVRRLRRAAGRLTAGDFEARAAFSGGGELSALADDFDTMAVALLEREHELRVSEQRAVEGRYRGLLDIAADAVVVLDGTGRVLLFNRGAEDMFGADADDVKGKVHADALGVDLLSDAEQHVLDRAGDQRWIEARWSEAADGLTTVIVRDVTDRVRAREARAVLRERDERFRLAQEHSAIGMALIGLDGRWLDVNRRCAASWGAPPASCCP